MIKRPIIFMAFANDSDNHLDMLKQEGRDVFRILSPIHDAQYIEVHREESAQLEDIFFNLNRFRDRLTIFHYGGHATGTKLVLEEGDAQAKGLAELLGEEKELQLVVLNGCSTKEQVQQLLDHGIKAVIATSVPVKDQMALDFAVQFYQALVNQSNLESAFRIAIAYLSSKHKTSPEPLVEHYRGFDLPLQTDKGKEVLPWGLYIHADHPEVAKWKLPNYRQFKLPENMGGTINANYKANEYIVAVLGTMAEYHKPIYRDMEDEWGDPRDPREFPELIIKNFPWPMGAQLRILVANLDAMNQASLPRLHQLVYAYVSTAKFFSYVLLSQLWEEINTSKLSPIPALEDLLTLTEETSKSYDFVQLMQELKPAFNNITPFIPEISAFWKKLENGQPLHHAYEFLEGLRQAIQSEDASFSDEELVQHCNQAEYCLREFLKGLAFLAKYKLITVKNIALFKHRHQDALYRVQLGVLNAFDQEFLRERTRDQNIHTDSHSVILIKSLKDMTQFLNLSPFIVDRNAYAGKPIPDIYMYRCRVGSAYQYLNVNYNVNKGQMAEGDLMDTNDSLNIVLQNQFKQFEQFVTSLNLN